MLTNTERPVGISILGMLHVITGLVTMIAAFVTLSAIPRPERFGVGLVEICLGIGLLRLLYWAPPTTTAVYGLAILGSISHGHIYTAIVASAVVGYLWIPGVRRAFAPRALGDSSMGVPKS